MRMDKVGPALWRGLHAITFDYPDTPSENQQRAAIALFESLQELLPCAACQKHYTGELRAHPVRSAVQGRDDLSKWLVDLHNRVNARLGKASMPYEQVRNEYLDCDMTCTADVAADDTAACCAAPAATHPPVRVALQASNSWTRQSEPWVMAAAAFLLGGLIVASIWFCVRRRSR
jgi:hypothetical protein